ncbi:MAG TPA: FAD-dependent oxidoreductase, partial [Ramlibacter sp.]
METFDLLVIGSGPAGRRAAVQGAKLGKSVMVVENRLRLGGVSVHTGTIPSKTLRETVLNLSGWRERGFYGLSYRVKKDIEGKDLGARLRMTLNHEIEVLEHQFARNGVRTFGGMAKFLDANRVCVTAPDGDETVFGFSHAVIAVGTTPYRPANIPFNDRSVVDSDSLVSEPRVPRSLTVVGAGVIGIEYATIFSALDVPVTIIEPKDTILDFIDREI